jgi:hypothetical protein
VFPGLVTRLGASQRLLEPSAAQVLEAAAQLTGIGIDALITHEVFLSG